MKALKIKNKFSFWILSMMLALFMGAGIAAIPVYAASGTVYTCVIHPVMHPVTGELRGFRRRGILATWGRGWLMGLFTHPGYWR